MSNKETATANQWGRWLFWGILIPGINYAILNSGFFGIFESRELLIIYGTIKIYRGSKYEKVFSDHSRKTGFHEFIKRSFRFRRIRFLSIVDQHKKASVQHQKRVISTLKSVSLTQKTRQHKKKWTDSFVTYWRFFLSTRRIFVEMTGLLCWTDGFRGEKDCIFLSTVTAWVSVSNKNCSLFSMTSKNVEVSI